MSWSCFYIPFNFPFMSLSCCRRLVSLCFVSLSFPLHSPCFHFCPFHVPFSSPPLFPFHFPVAFLTCRRPISSPHFLALPCISPLLHSIFLRNNTVFSSVFAKRMSNKRRVFQMFGKRRQETQTRKEPAGGFEPGTPVLRHQLPEDYV